MDTKRRATPIMIVIILVLGIVLTVFFIHDRKNSVIERKTGYSLPDYCTIEEYVGYGSIFNRTGFEFKAKIDSVEHMNEVITTLHKLYGDDHHEIDLSEFNIKKYSLFAGQKIIPKPTTISWVIVGRLEKGSVVGFVDIEDTTQPYVYMYYAE